MKKTIIIPLLLLFQMSLSAQVCAVDSIQVPSCVDFEYVVPVDVFWQGKADSMKIEVSGLDYNFPVSFFRSYHFSSPMTFNFYHLRDTILNNISITATLIGGDCTGQTLTKAIEYDNCELCQDVLLLAGTPTKNLYEARVSITTTQNVTATLVYSSPTVVLDNNFMLQENTTLDINHIGCS